MSSFYLNPLQDYLFQPVPYSFCAYLHHLDHLPRFASIRQDLNMEQRTFQCYLPKTGSPRLKHSSPKDTTYRKQSAPYLAAHVRGESQCKVHLVSLGHP